MALLKYDVDSSTWSPQGKLLQVDYAKEAVKQGSICVALHSERAAVLLSIKKNPSKLATYQEKIFKVSDDVGVGIAGMTGDARRLIKFMHTENNKKRIKTNANSDADDLAHKLAKKMQDRTISYGKRPYGVGLLVVGKDGDGFGVFELTPAGDIIEYDAFAIGAKSTSARTYLEKHLSAIRTASDADLVQLGVAAINNSFREEKEGITEKNLEIAIVTEDEPFKIYSLQQIRDALEHSKTFVAENIPQKQMIIE